MTLSGPSRSVMKYRNSFRSFPQPELDEFFNSMPGCKLNNVTDLGQSDYMRLIGWSPTLHEAAMLWEIKPDDICPEIQTNKDLIGVLKRTKGDFIEIQRERAERGRALGFDAPIRKDAEITDHIHMSESLFLFILDKERGKEKPNIVYLTADFLSEAHLPENQIYEQICRELMMQVKGYDGGRENQTYRKIVVVERHDKSGKMQSYAYFRLYFDKLVDAPIENMTFELNDNKLEFVMPKQLPEAVVAQLPGRNLGSLIEIHPVIDRRTIINAVTRGNNVITLELEDDAQNLGYLKEKYLG